LERLVGGASAELLVQAFAGRARPPALYLVVTTTGVMAKLEVPAGFRIHELGPAYVVGVYRDADDLEYIRLYRLRR
jgi:hypothetical protein